MDPRALPATGRVIGTETEYGAWSRDPERTAAAALMQAAGRQRVHGQWLSNGARFYQDIGAHPEYATPETRHPADAARHALAGDAILAEHASELGDVTILRHNIDLHGVVWGHHENYQIPPHLKRPDLEPLLGHLATRLPLVGGGHVNDDGELLLSARAAATTGAFDNASVDGRRPLILERPLAPHADLFRWQRLQVAAGDPPVSDWTRWLQLATTDLVLAVIEAAPQRAAALTIDRPVAALKRLNTDVTLQETVSLLDGTRLTALEHQRAWAETAAEVRPDLAATAEAWAAVCDADALATKVDWAVKGQLLEPRRRRGDSGQALQAAALAYHDPAPDSRLRTLLTRRGLLETLWTDDEIAEAAVRPPQSRAQARTRLLQAAVDHTQVDYLVQCTWMQLSTIRPKDYERLSWRLPDPADPDPPELARALDELAGR